jgi:hypothetical protein
MDLRRLERFWIRAGDLVQRPPHFEQTGQSRHASTLVAAQ